MAATAKIISFDEWRAMPETNRPYEILDGKLIQHPSPPVLHQFIVGNLIASLSDFAKRNKQGVAILSPIDLVIRRDPLRTRQPDLLYISFERSGKSLRELRAMPFLEITLELAIEVLSADCERATAMEKVQDYIVNGSRECWLVSSQAETVEVLSLSPKGVARIGLFGAGDTVHSEVLPEFRMKVDYIFA